MSGRGEKRTDSTPNLDPSTYVPLSLPWVLPQGASGPGPDRCLLGLPQPVLQTIRDESHRRRLPLLTGPLRRPRSRWKRDPRGSEASMDAPCHGPFLPNSHIEVRRPSPSDPDCAWRQGQRRLSRCPDVMWPVPL